ncbi:type IV pilin [Halomarina ordinaria]|uniref:Type IV pilin n=1 Tax=Halomarina ordinaria TaxID=3033939 RepID=A0ABD5UGB0_9EURY|nr:type IV pilin [Halomarina sp. PSRA2]
MTDRAVSPVVAVVCLLAVTVAAAATVGVFAQGLADSPTAAPAPTAALSLAVDAEDDELALTHRSGDPIDPDDLRLRVAVDGDPLARQPPVPFFSARGFESGPTGAFNSATGGDWRAGETARLRLAGTNTAIEEGSHVTVRVWVDGRPVARLGVRA